MCLSLETLLFAHAHIRNVTGHVWEEVSGRGRGSFARADAMPVFTRRMNSRLLANTNWQVIACATGFALCPKVSHSMRECVETV